MLLDAWQVADKLAADTPTLLRLVERGQCPAPITLGDLNRWQAEALTTWVSAGCPAVDPPSQAEFRSIRVRHVDEDVARLSK